MWSLEVDMAHACRFGTSGPYETTNHAHAARGHTRWRRTTRNHPRMCEAVPRGTEPCRSVCIVRSVRTDYSEPRWPLHTMYDRPSITGIKTDPLVDAGGLDLGHKKYPQLLILI